MVGDLDRGGIALEGLAVDVERDLGVGRAVVRDALLGECDVPLGEELSEGVRLGGFRLGVEDAVGIMGVQLGDAGLLAAGRLDAAVPRAERTGELLDRRIVDVDADAGRHLYRLAVDEDVEVAVDVVLQVLDHLEHHARLARQCLRVVRRRPENEGLVRAGRRRR